ncbi:MAG TPA: DUF3618 domain-containing protein [Gaiellaceae bacterium]
MATRNGRSPEDVRRDIESQRERLAASVEDLRDGIGEATDLRRVLEGKLPVATAAALGAGFFLAGGIGATMRLIMRRSREGHTRARLGHFSLVDRD